MNGQRWQIRITGVVQGVGFRPFVHQLAMRMGLNGWVRNDGAGVLVELTAGETIVQQLVQVIRHDAPPLSRIDAINVSLIDMIGEQHHAKFAGFAIVASIHHPDDEPISTIVPTDSHVCADCLREMSDPADRRYRYPFINCTHCGPRFSIIKKLPYDRANTTMATFALCADCQAEYDDPESRRYHAQPIACPICGPQLQWIDGNGDGIHGEDALTQARMALRAGQVVAVKSLGGFHLAVDARNGSAVQLLRIRKRRDAKPFALMVRDSSVAAQLAQVSALERTYLEAVGRPIVLLKKRRGTADNAWMEAVAPRNPSLGLMLPSASLHYLLFDDELDVLVMTSGNVSGQPIEYTNDGARAHLLGIADGILAHDREIYMRIDDSVLRITEHPQLAQPLTTWLRRARGYAPYVVDVANVVDVENVAAHDDGGILALGAELKTTVALSQKLSQNHRVYLSQHIGDLKNPNVLASQRMIARHLANLYQIAPQTVVGDAHPSFHALDCHDFASAQHTQRVQHHHAHMAACMAEHGLRGQTLGVVFDGAGYGSDGTVWGGEFLLGDYAQVERVAHLQPIALIGGDKAVFEPLRIAFALVKMLPVAQQTAALDLPCFASLSAAQQRLFAQMLAQNLNTFQSSGMGRLFDGVAALLNLCTRAEYEAQGPIELEGLLERDLTLLDESVAYRFDCDNTIYPWRLCYENVVADIVADMQRGIDATIISRKFHSGLVYAVVQLCQTLRTKHQFHQVVLSGGVFLNEFLCVNLLLQLRHLGISAYAHHNVPAGDGGISLGQVMVNNERYL